MLVTSSEAMGLARCEQSVLMVLLLHSLQLTTRAPVALLQISGPLQESHLGPPALTSWAFFLFLLSISFPVRSLPPCELLKHGRKSISERFGAPKTAFDDTKYCAFAVRKNKHYDFGPPRPAGFPHCELYGVSSYATDVHAYTQTNRQTDKQTHDWLLLWPFVRVLVSLDWMMLPDAEHYSSPDGDIGKNDTLAPTHDVCSYRCSY